jgi:hypothetical protein
MDLPDTIASFTSEKMAPGEIIDKWSDIQEILEITQKAPSQKKRQSMRKLRRNSRGTEEPERWQGEIFS